MDIDRANILITGGAGFMGSSFIRYLLEKESFIGKVVNYDALTYCGNLENLRSVCMDTRYTFVKGDILDRALFEKTLNNMDIDVIVHFAAETHVDRSIEEGSPFLSTNILGTAALLDIVRKYPSIHFHHISTDEVYGALGETGVFTETSPYLPNSPYSASKAASDHLVRAYAKTYGLSTTISHAGNNYGPCQFPEKLIPLMLTKMMHKEPLPIYGQGNQRREWLYVEDHAKAIEVILTKGHKGEVYNISGGKELANLELVLLLIDEYAHQAKEDPKGLVDKIVFVKDRPGHDFRYAMDGHKMQSLGWVPLISLQEGIRRTVAWYVNQAQPLCEFA